MSGTWYPSLREQVEAERRVVAPDGDDVFVDEIYDDNPYPGDLDWETAIIDLATAGDHVALDVVREQFAPFDHTEYDMVG